jgi:acyl-CoA thioester hydrolase
MNIDTSYPVKMTEVVEWGDMDSFGHVNNCKYFRYFENCRLLYFSKVGLFLTSVRGLSHDNAQGPILARTGAEFKRPITFPDTLRVEAGTTRIGNSSFTMGYRVWSETQQEIAAEGESVVVYYDYANGHSVPLSEEILQKLREIEGQA